MALFIHLASRRLSISSQESMPKEDLNEKDSNEAAALDKEMEVLQQNIEYEAKMAANMIKADKHSGASAEFMATSKAIADKKAKEAAEYKKSKQKQIDFAKSRL